MQDEEKTQGPAEPQKWQANPEALSGNFRVRVDEDGNTETYLIGAMTRGTAMQLIGKIAKVHRLEVTIKVRER